jgi:hypothetical protein
MNEKLLKIINQILLDSGRKEIGSINEFRLIGLGNINGCDRRRI